MPLDDLLHGFERETEAEIAAIHAQAELDAAAVEAEAAVRRRDTIAGAGDRHAECCRREADQRVAAAERDARTQVLDAQAEVLARVRAEVANALRARLAQDEVLIRALVASAVDCAGDTHGTLHCPPELERLVRVAAPPRFAVATEPGAAAGIVIELATGTRIDATLDGLLEREWSRLACEALGKIA